MRFAWKEPCRDAFAFERGSRGNKVMESDEKDGCGQFYPPYYLGWYERAEKVKEAAYEAGYSGKEGESWYDFVDPSLKKYRALVLLHDLDELVSWLRSEIKAGKTCFGVASIVHLVPIPNRCANCNCGVGWVDHEYSVDESGIIEDNVLEPPCDVEVA